MTVVECLVQRSLPGDGVCNEDRARAMPTAAWVLDGATGLGDSLLPYPTDAAWFVEAFDDALADELSKHPDEPTIELLRRAIKVVGSRFEIERHQEATSPHQLPSAAFAMVRLFGDRVEFSALGDCRILYRSDDSPVQTFTAEGVGGLEAETLAELALLYANDPALTVAEAKQLIMPRLRQNRMQMNTSSGYWILSLDPNAVDHLVQQTVDLRGKRLEVAIGSDGLMRLDEVFAAVAPHDILAADTEDSVDALFSRLRRLEAEDENCRKCPPSAPMAQI